MNTKEFLAQDWVKEEIISRLNYNPETGSLTWAERDCAFFDKSRVGEEVGCSWNQNGYVQKTLQLEIKGRRVNLVVARLCWLVHTGDWPKYTVDHIDRDSLNNKWSNLRDVTQKVNNSNKGFYKGNVLHHLFLNGHFWNVRFYGKVVGKSKCLGEAIKIRNKYTREKS